eukprot:6187668-Pleurochrysis_carterae.AAC.5
MVLLDADAFLTQLTRILESTRTKGTMYVTMKRCALLRTSELLTLNCCVFIVLFRMICWSDLVKHRHGFI